VAVPTAGLVGLAEGGRETVGDGVGGCVAGVAELGSAVGVTGVTVCVGAVETEVVAGAWIVGLSLPDARPPLPQCPHSSCSMAAISSSRRTWRPPSNGVSRKTDRIS
jgi:hypothetical protein